MSEPFIVAVIPSLRSGQALSEAKDLLDSSFDSQQILHFAQNDRIVLETGGFAVDVVPAVLDGAPDDGDGEAI